MADDIEERLAAAAQALREHEITAQRGMELRRRMDGLSTQVASMQASYAEERRDIEQLEGVSLARVLAALRGAREDRLARERAEADAARLRAGEAQARLDAVRREYEAAQAQLGELAEAPATYVAVLAEKERRLGETGGPRGQRLLELADERGRLTGELREIEEAARAAATAGQALDRVREALGSASSWSTYDTFFGGGAISSAVKHNRLDRAAEAAAYADRCLAVLRTELADVGGTGLAAPQLAADRFTRFVDIWFDNIFTDLAVRDQIKQAQQQVAGSAELVSQVQARLAQRTEAARGRLDQLESERHDLLTRPEPA